ncbi:tRNA wybutosine-synthesizing protein 2 homolog [Diadema antillarum]|uniref:tRNA wybutosine-synthesizing protein 2 homolog n=1 Tax=Diadema antillarum TaxID=105358 RepID=UPI003A83D7DE
MASPLTANTDGNATEMLALVVDVKQAQKIRMLLEKAALWDDGRRLVKLKNSEVAIPVKPTLTQFLWNEFRQEDIQGASETKSPSFQSRKADSEKDHIDRKVVDKGSKCLEQESDVLFEQSFHYSVTGAHPSLSENTDKDPVGADPKNGSLTIQTDQAVSCYMDDTDSSCQSESGSQSICSKSSQTASCSSSMRKEYHHSGLKKNYKELWRGELFECECKLVSISLPPSKKRQIRTPFAKLREEMEKSLKEAGMEWSDSLLDKDLPRSWERHGDLVLLPQACFQDSVWSSVQGIWSHVAKALDCQRLAKRGRIRPDDFRSPRTDLLLGSDPYVEHRDNGIMYNFDIRYSMFSAGNITEKLRVATLDCAGETVVDLYAGIGYFTLPYLVHGKADFVYACEWNPHAVTALSRNLKLNGVAARCQVLEGDNRKVCPRGVADRVNLGLIPSSEEGWPVACAALKPMSGGMLHIHGNVTSHPQNKWSNPCGDMELDSKYRLQSSVADACTGKDTTDIDCDAEEKPGERDYASDSVTSQDEHRGEEDCSPSHTTPKEEEWLRWAEDTAAKIKHHLQDAHHGVWCVEKVHIENVKSYAPHVHHLVLDLHCYPER